MNIKRTHTITISAKELREALKLRFPDDIAIRSLPLMHGPVKVELVSPDGGISIHYWHDVATAENAAVADKHPLFG